MTNLELILWQSVPGNAISVFAIVEATTQKEQPNCNNFSIGSRKLEAFRVTFIQTRLYLSLYKCFFFLKISSLWNPVISSKASFKVKLTPHFWQA